MSVFCKTCPMAFDTKRGLSNHKRACRGLIANLFKDGLDIATLAVRFRKTYLEIESVLRSEMVRRKAAERLESEAA